MSDLISMLTQQLGGDAIKQISGKLGTSESQSTSAISAALPVLLGALAKNSSKGDGASSLDNALSKDHDGSILNNLGGFINSFDQGPGDGILKHVLGDRRANVEQFVGKSSGLSSGSTSQLMTMLAPIVMGALGKEKRQNNLNSDGIAGLLGSVLSSSSKSNPQSSSLVNSLLDADGDGSIADDLLNMGSKLFGSMFKK